MAKLNGADHGELSLADSVSVEEDALWQLRFVGGGACVSAEELSHQLRNRIGHRLFARILELVISGEQERTSVRVGDELQRKRSDGSEEEISAKFREVLRRLTPTTLGSRGAMFNRFSSALCGGG